MTFKAFDTLRAEAALRGFELHAIRDDHERPLFIAVRGAEQAEFHALDEVRDWLAAMPSPFAMLGVAV